MSYLVLSVPLAALLLVSGAPPMTDPQAPALTRASASAFAKLAIKGARPAAYRAPAAAA